MFYLLFFVFLFGVSSVFSMDLPSSIKRSLRKRPRPLEPLSSSPSLPSLSSVPSPSNLAACLFDAIVNDRRSVLFSLLRRPGISFYLSTVTARLALSPFPILTPARSIFKAFCSDYSSLSSSSLPSLSSSVPSVLHFRYDDSGYCKPHYIADAGYYDLLKCLLDDTNLSPDLKNKKNGNTLLLLAVFKLHVDVVRLLVENGANCKHKNDDGVSARGYIKGECKRLKKELMKVFGTKDGGKVKRRYKRCLAIRKILDKSG